MRCTSGAGSELLMGFHESKSLLYLEARCLCLQRGMGVQGTQNGGIDGAPLPATIPGGVRELMAEKLLAVWLDLECASGNDARSTESEIRVGAKILPFLIAGSDLICSGFGSILKYDNSFNASLLNGEEMEDFLVLQRDFEADGGLTPVPEGRILELRRRAVDAIGAVLEELGLPAPTAAMKESVVFASGSAETRSYTPGQGGTISGPGAGARVGEPRRPELNAIRDVLEREEALRAEARSEKDEARRIQYRTLGPAEPGGSPREVVIGISPAFGLKLFQTLAGHPLSA